MIQKKMRTIIRKIISRNVWMKPYGILPSASKEFLKMSAKFFNLDLVLFASFWMISFFDVLFLMTISFKIFAWAFDQVHLTK